METLPQMHCLGLNYRTSSVAVRECFAVPRYKLAAVNEELKMLPGVEENVLLSTCNRTEIYYWTHDGEQALESLCAYFLKDRLNTPPSKDIFYHHEGEDALFHLARVAAGLDSMVLGETEIFGQLKEAYRMALEAASTASSSNRIFQQIFGIAKKIRTESRITSGPTSVGAVAVQMAHGILGGLNGAHVLVVGAGEVARTTAQSLRSRGAEGIFVANRSYERALQLAEQIGGKVIRFTEWIPYLEKIDIVIVSTASPAYVVSPPVLQKVQQKRRRPLFLIDLSVPRNVDPSCANLAQVHVFDIDAMEKMTEETHRLRAAEVADCERMIRSWMAENARNLLSSRPFYAEKLPV